MVRQHVLVLALTVFTLLGFGCTESGTPIDAAVAPSSDGTPSSGGVNTNGGVVGANGGVSGELWVTGARNTKRINLQTGEETFVSVDDAYPSRDGSIFVEHLKDVSSREEEPGCHFLVYDKVAEINVRNTRTNAVISSFETLRNISGPVRLSPDGERVGLFASQIERCSSNYGNSRFTVYSKDGDQLFRDENGFVIDFDWHPDGRLLVLKSNSLDDNLIQVETAPGSYEFEIQVNWSAPPGVGGYRGLRVGPTGNDAVLEATSGGNHFLSTVKFRYGAPHHFRLFDDGPLGETDLFDIEPGVGQLNGVTFSPDGKHLLVTEGYTAGAAVFSADSPPVTELDDLAVVPVYTGSTSYIVPVGAREQPMPPLQYSENIRPVLVKNESGELRPISINPLLNLTWTPAID